MRLHELEDNSRLTELFNGSSILPYKINNKSTSYEGMFEIENSLYHVDFWTNIDNNNDLWTFEFTHSDLDDEEDETRTHYNTGSGNEFKVYATVLKIAQDFIKTKNPKIVKFSGEGKREKLYMHMIKRLQHSIESLGYKTNIDPIIGANISDFTLIKESNFMNNFI